VPQLCRWPAHEIVQRISDVDAATERSLDGVPAEFTFLVGELCDVYAQRQPGGSGRHLAVRRWLYADRALGREQRALRDDNRRQHRTDNTFRTRPPQLGPELLVPAAFLLRTARAHHSTVREHVDSSVAKTLAPHRVNGLRRRLPGIDNNRNVSRRRTGVLHRETQRTKYGGEGGARVNALSGTTN